VLAAAPITWGVCELPDWGDVPPWQQVLDEMAAAGFRGTELGPPDYLPQNPEHLLQELRARQLALVGAFCPVSLHRPEPAPASLDVGEALAQRLSALECPLLIAADAGDDQRRAIAGRADQADQVEVSGRQIGLADDEWARLADGLVELARRCAPHGVRVVFHPHAGTYVETRHEVDSLLALTPPDLIGLCLDTGHLAYGGADPVEVCQSYAGRVWHVHAKDVRSNALARVRAERIDYATAVGMGIFAPLGDGTVAFPALLDALREANYDGWYVVEQDVRLGSPWPAQHPAANAQRSATYLRALLTSPPGPLSETERGNACGTIVGDHVPLSPRERGRG
jgi:inosose dehydratase